MIGDAGPSVWTTSAFVALTVAVAVVIVAGVRAAAQGCGLDEADARRRQLAAAALVGGWLAVSAALAASGALARFELRPPPLMVFIGATVVASTTFALTGFGSMLARGLPVAALVGFHAFRVPLEMLLHRLMTEGALPVQMTWSGMNYDVASGIGALVVGAWAAIGQPPRFVLVLWNLIAFALLLVIVTVAILSAPLPLRVFMNEPANAIVATAPYIWLPCFLVQAAWVGHIVMFRRLRRMGRVAV